MSEKQKLEETIKEQSIKVATYAMSYFLGGSAEGEIDVLFHPSRSQFVVLGVASREIYRDSMKEIEKVIKETLQRKQRTKRKPTELKFVTFSYGDLKHVTIKGIDRRSGEWNVAGNTLNRGIRHREKMYHPKDPNLEELAERKKELRETEILVEKIKEQIRYISNYKIEFPYAAKEEREAFEAEDMLITRYKQAEEAVEISIRKRKEGS